MSPSGILVPPHLNGDLRYLRAASWWSSLEEQERQNIFNGVEESFPFCSQMIAHMKKDWSQRRFDVRSVYALYQSCRKKIHA